MEKNEKTNFSEMLKDKKYRGIVFFVFYGIIFIVLIVFIRTGSSNNPSKPVSSPTPSPLITPKPSNILTNYNFVYTIKENDNTAIFTGKTFDNKQEFTSIINGKTRNFYKLGDNYLSKENSKYVVTTNPYLYPTFLDLTKLNAVLDLGEAKEASNISTYTVAVLDIFDVFTPDIDYDGFEIAKIKDDKIIVTRANNNITKVEYDLSNFIDYYSKLTKGHVSKLTITLEYTNINQTADFTIPKVN
ncbi:MAG: hypothetical protein RSA48_03485 [Bacilli bacterium]